MIEPYRKKIHGRPCGGRLYSKFHGHNRTHNLFVPNILKTLDDKIESSPKKVQQEEEPQKKKDEKYENTQPFIYNKKEIEEAIQKIYEQEKEKTAETPPKCPFCGSSLKSKQNYN